MGEAKRSGGQGSPCSRYRRLGHWLLYSLVNAASKGIERSPYLRSAYGERRRHADGRSAHQVDEDALIQTVLEDLPGKAEVEPEQESFAPHLRAGDLLRKLLQCVLQHGPLETYFFEEGYIIHHAEHGLHSGHRQRVASEGRAVVARPQRGVVLLDHHRPYGEPATKTLGAGEHVGDDVRPLVSVQMSRASRAGLDLVEDEERPVLVAKPA